MKWWIWNYDDMVNVWALGVCKKGEQKRLLTLLQKIISRESMLVEIELLRQTCTVLEVTMVPRNCTMSDFHEDINCRPPLISSYPRLGPMVGSKSFIIKYQYRGGTCILSKGVIEVICRGSPWSTWRAVDHVNVMVNVTCDIFWLKMNMVYIVMNIGMSLLSVSF